MKNGRGVYYDVFGLVHQNGLFYLDSMRIFTTGSVDESRLRDILREADVNIKRIRLLGNDPSKDRRTWAAEALQHQKVGIDDNLTQAGRVERKCLAPLRQDIMRQGAIPVWRNGAELYIKERPGGKAQPYGPGMIPTATWAARSTVPTEAIAIEKGLQLPSRELTAVNMSVATQEAVKEGPSAAGAPEVAPREWQQQLRLQQPGRGVYGAPRWRPQGLQLRPSQGQQTQRQLLHQRPPCGRVVCGHRYPHPWPEGQGRQ
ncbi:hypothetical protein VOLCADRAFT_95295 [Volvox carteri f. nagariensis]|uniref:Uncharacterized protein n=1 Tax=Volvox carteri f. nagariensis TaxID=3068 RepID=D8U742_VOLCA|nr:uncharacterized protein VOLCADRAFT_95295 [Volvox carteri f. nagariensis]EFJ44414.1 hypothetical protein VOLCADRAFT_95295 [Volvox carteri f. nagariensis]|eukprot:XP_002954521.1 hypothetical protein VOLCADRAFT_95295 [Volvox carteri f. nagariensis]